MTDPVNAPILPPPLQDETHKGYLKVIEALLAKMDPTFGLHYRLSRSDSVTPHPAALHFLGRQFSVTGWDGWNVAQTEAQKRRLLADAIPIHMTKGTPGGVELALSKLGLPGAIVVERPGAGRTTPHRYDGTKVYDGSITYDGLSIAVSKRWATFRVTLPGPELSASFGGLAAIRATIEEFKRGSVHLVGLDAASVMDDELPSTDAAMLIARPRFEEEWMAGLRYDGSINYGGELAIRYDGSRDYDGSFPYDGQYRLPAEVHYYNAGQFRERARTIPRLRIAEQLTEGVSRYDGTLTYDGQARYDAAPAGFTDLSPRLFIRQGAILEAA